MGVQVPPPVPNDFFKGQFAMSEKTFKTDHQVDLVSKSSNGKTINYKAVVNTLADEELEKSFSVNILSADLEKVKDFKLGYLVTQANLKGFRPGKAPINIVWNQHKDKLLNEIASESINEAVSAIITVLDRDLITSPAVNVKKFSLEDGLEFEITIHLTPKFDLPNVNDLSLEKLTYEITDEDVTHRVKNLMKQHKNFEAAKDTHKTENGDRVIIDFEGKIDGVAFTGGSAKDHTLDLGSKTFIDNFEDQLLNHKAGDKILVKVNFPKNYHKVEFAEKPAEFDVVIKQILQAKECKTEEDFSKSVGFESVEEMKKRVKEGLDKECSERSRIQGKIALFDKLDNICEFNLPQMMIDQEFNQLWKNIENMDKGKDKSESELKEEYLKLAKRRVKLGVLLAEMAKKYSVKVSQQDLVEAVKAQAMSNPAMAQAIIKFYTDNKNAVESLKGPIVEEKVVQHILADIKIIEKPIKVQELLELANA